MANGLEEMEINLEVKDTTTNKLILLQFWIGTNTGRLLSLENAHVNLCWEDHECTE